MAEQDITVIREKQRASNSAERTLLIRDTNEEDKTGDNSRSQQHPSSPDQWQKGDMNAKHATCSTHRKTKRKHRSRQSRRDSKRDDASSCEDFEVKSDVQNCLDILNEHERKMIIGMDAMLLGTKVAVQLMSSVIKDQSELIVELSDSVKRLEMSTSTLLERGIQPSQQETPNQGGYRGRQRGDYSRGGYIGRGDYSRGGYIGRGDYSRGSYRGRGDYSRGSYRGRGDYSRVGYIGRGDYSRGGYKGRGDDSRGGHRGRGDYSRGGYRGRDQARGQGNNTTNTTHPDLKCYTCNDNHYQYQCTAAKVSPEVQQPSNPQVDHPQELKMARKQKGYEKEKENSIFELRKQEPACLPPQ
jgi:hypothetical protein